MSAAQAFRTSPWFIDPKRVLHVRKIGDGGFAEVYESKLDGGDTLVAAKHAKGITTLVGSGLRRFTTEIEMLSKLDHPNIVKTIGACLGNRANMLIMDLHPGSLRDVIDIANSCDAGAPPPLPWQDRVRILAQIAEGIEYLHKNKIVHRDLKAANVLISADLQPKITDFGFAVTKAATTQTTVRSGTTVGTTAWMAPEVFRGTFSNNTDVWGLACIAVELITYDDSPFQGRFASGDQLVAYLKDCDGEIDFGSSNWRLAATDAAASKHVCTIEDPSGGCPPSLLPILASCFVRDHSARPSAAAVAQRLNSLLKAMDPIHSTRRADSFYAPSMPAAACRAVLDALVDKRNMYAEGSVPVVGVSNMDFAAASESMGDKSRAIITAAGERARNEAAMRAAEKARADSLERRIKALQLDREKEDAERRVREKVELEMSMMLREEEEAWRKKQLEEEDARRKKQLEEDEARRKKQLEEDEERRRKAKEEDAKKQAEYEAKERQLREALQRARDQTTYSSSYSSYQPAPTHYTPSYSSSSYAAPSDSSPSYAAPMRSTPAAAPPKSSGGVFSGSYHSSSGSANGRALFTGPRGGTYYHTASGGKKYV